MSQTTRNPPTATFNEPIYQAYVHEIQEDLGAFGLLVGLYGTGHSQFRVKFSGDRRTPPGILIALSLLSTYILVTRCVLLLRLICIFPNGPTHVRVDRCTRKTRRTTIMLSSIIFTLLASTTIYTVTWILARQTDFLRFLIESGVMLWSEDNIDTSFIEEGWGPVRLKSYPQMQYCAGTVALTINVCPPLKYSELATASLNLCSSQITLGDAIVCWRACVVWHGSIAVKVACSVFLMSTFGESIPPLAT